MSTTGNPTFPSPDKKGSKVLSAQEKRSEEMRAMIEESATNTVFRLKRDHGDYIKTTGLDVTSMDLLHKHALEEDHERRGKKIDQDILDTEKAIKEAEQAYREMVHRQSPSLSLFLESLGVHDSGTKVQEGSLKDSKKIDKLRKAIEAQLAGISDPNKRENLAKIRAGQMGKFETLLASDENNSPIETTLPSPERIITEEQAEKIMGSKNMISSKKSLERFRVNEEVSHIPFNEDALRIAREKNFTLFFVPEQMSLSTKDKNNFDMKGGWRLFAKAPALDREGKEMEDHLSQIESLIKERVALGSPTPELVTAISEYRKAKPALTAFLRSPDVADQEEAIKLTSGLMIVKILRPSVNDVAVLSSLTGEFPGPTWTHDRDNRSLPSYVDFNSQTQDFSVNSRLSGLRCPSSYCFSA